MKKAQDEDSQYHHETKGGTMTTSNHTNRGYASGFVKRLKNNLKQKVVTFGVANKKFILPEKSTFTTVIRVADVCKWNVLILFENNGNFYPRITGVISKPLWVQVKEASDGADYEAVKALCSEGRPL